jgi:hypothetical protein
MKRVWKWKLTITFVTGMSLETEVKAESIKKAIASMEYTAKKMNGEITSIQKGEEYENENQGCQSD